MDLGATVCLPRQPLCGACPVQANCAGLQRGSPQDFPVRSRKLRRSARSVWLLMARNRGLSLVGGRSDHRGFYIVGAVDTDRLAAAADEALRRLQRGTTG